jgi:predicted transposase YbfD/YdcC
VTGVAWFVWTRLRQVAGRRVIPIDGKTVRGARTVTTRAPHLVAALDHDTGVVVGQIAVPAKSDEISAVRDLLAGFDPANLHGCVIAVDAMHTQADTARAVLAAGADYVFTVKANQAGLHQRLKTMPWRDVPAHSYTDTSRGGRTTRTTGILPDRDGLHPRPAAPTLSTAPWRPPPPPGPDRHPSRS